MWRAGGARCAAGEQIRTVAARRPGYTTSCCPGPYTVHLSFTLICRDIHPSCTSEVTQELSNQFFNFSIIILFIFLNILGEHRYPVAQNPRYTLFIKSYMNFVLRTWLKSHNKECDCYFQNPDELPADWRWNPLHQGKNIWKWFWTTRKIAKTPQMTGLFRRSDQEQNTTVRSGIWRFLFALIWQNTFAEHTQL